MTPLPWETTALEPKRSRCTGSTIVMVFADTARVLSYKRRFISLCTQYKRVIEGERGERRERERRERGRRGSPFLQRQSKEKKILGPC